MTFLSILRDRRFLFVAALFAVMVLARATGLTDMLSVDGLRLHRATLTGWVSENRVLAAGAYLTIYAACVSLSFPAAGLITLTGGFLFGATLGTALTVLAATTGATIVFFGARSLFGARAIEGLGTRAASLAAALRANAAPFMLAIRLVPVFPFFLVNLVAALVGIAPRIFILTTLIGIIPVTYAISTAGAGLGRVLDRGDDVSMLTMLTPDVWGVLAALGALSLAAIPLRRFIEKRHAGRVDR